MKPVAFHVKYEVLANGKLIYQSPTAGIIPIDVSLPPKTKTIELKVDGLGDNTCSRRTESSGLAAL